jgi:hypothetical protein
VAAFGFDQENLVRSQRHPLYPALYPRTNFQSQRSSATAKGKTKKIIVDIKQISGCIPKLKIAKSPFFD